jgi:hypothetical protein
VISWYTPALLILQGCVHVSRMIQTYWSCSHITRLLSLQEINHAGDGGIWAELVSNRGDSAMPAFHMPLF